MDLWSRIQDASLSDEQFVLAKKLERRILELEAANKEQERQIRRLEEKADDTENKLRQEKKRAETLDSLLQKEREARSFSLASKEEEKLLAEAEISTLDEAKTILEREVDRLLEIQESMKEEVEAVSKERDSIAEESRVLCERLEQAEQSLESLRRENDDLEAELEAARRSRETFWNHSIALHKEKTRLEEQLSLLTKITQNFSTPSRPKYSRQNSFTSQIPGPKPSKSVQKSSSELGAPNEASGVQHFFDYHSTPGGFPKALSYDSKPLSPLTGGKVSSFVYRGANGKYMKSQQEEPDYMSLEDFPIKESVKSASEKFSCSLDKDQEKDEFNPDSTITNGVGATGNGASRDDHIEPQEVQKDVIEVAVIDTGKTASNPDSSELKSFRSQSVNDSLDESTASSLSSSSSRRGLEASTNERQPLSRTITGDVVLARRRKGWEAPPAEDKKEPEVIEPLMRQPRDRSNRRASIASPIRTPGKQSPRAWK